MSIYLIKIIVTNGYIPLTGYCNAFVLSAKNESNARGLAALNCSHEGFDIWKDSSLSICIEIGLALDLVERIILGNFQS